VLLFIFKDSSQFQDININHMMLMPKINEQKIKLKINRSFGIWLVDLIGQQIKGQGMNLQRNDDNPVIKSILAELYNMIADRINKSDKKEISISVKRHHAHLLLKILSNMQILDPLYLAMSIKVIKEIDIKMINHEVSIVDE
jgi:hypothetical protein